MSRPVALSVIVVGTLLVGTVAAIALARALSPVLAFADSTQRAAIHGDASSTSVAPGYAASVPSPATSKPAPSVTTNHCAGNAKARAVIVSLKAQHAWYCSGTKLAFDSKITTGRTATRTPTGHFTVRAKLNNTVLTPNTGEHYFVKYWIAFSGTEYGFHDASWQKIPFGSTKYSSAGSHGCVHLPLKAAKFLYSWATVGTAVTIA
jgi:hypothetical protein